MLHGLCFGEEAGARNLVFFRLWPGEILEIGLLTALRAHGNTGTRPIHGHTGTRGIHGHTGKRAHGHTRAIDRPGQGPTVNPRAQESKKD